METEEEKVIRKIKPRKVFKHWVEKGGSVGSAMVAAGYSPITAKNPSKVTKTKEWQNLLGDYLSDEVLAKEHQKLLNQKQLNYFVFPKSLSDEEIKSHVEANGLELIVIRESDKGKMAFYSIDDPNAKKNALEMAYKLKNRFTDDEKGKVGNIIINLPVSVIKAHNLPINANPDTETGRGDTLKGEIQSS